MNTINPEPFFYWINERHMVHVRRAGGEPWPWTQDRILKEYRFCNVFRELDTVTQWVDKNIRQPYADHPALWHMLLTARFINWPGTLAELIDNGAWYIGGNYDWNILAQFLHARGKAGKHVWTNAYTVSTNGNTINKPDYILGHVLQGAWEQRALIEPVARNGRSLEKFCTVAQQVDGIGGFMAYEVACDLRWCPGWLDQADDIYTWANPGPGAKRGLNRLAYRPLKQGMTVAKANEEMRYLLSLAPLYLGQHVPDLEMRDIEHSLCETDKYLRVQNGEGAPRSKYNPPNQGRT